MRRTEVLQGIRQMKFEEVYERSRGRRLSQFEAASVLGVLERTFRRWRDRFEAEGAEGLYDRRRWRPGHREGPIRPPQHGGYSRIGPSLQRRPV